MNVIPFFIVHKIIHKKQCNLSLKAFSIMAPKALNKFMCFKINIYRYKNV